MPPPVRASRVRDVVAIAVLACAAVVFMSAVLARPGHRVYIGASVHGAPWTRYLANDAGDGAAASTGWGVIGLGDTLRGVYTLAWWSHVLLDETRVESFYDANVLYPTRRALTYADLQLGVVPWFAPVWGASRNAVLAYQAAQLAGVVGCAIGFFVLLRSWTGSALAGVVAGLASIVAPYRAGSASLLYLHFLLYLPFALACVDAVLAGRRRVLALCGLVVCLVLQASSSGYLTYLCFLLVPAYALAALLEGREPARGRAIPPLVLAGTIAAALVVWVYRPFVALASSGSYGGAPAHNPWLLLLWSAPWANVRQHVLGNVGVPVLALAAVGVFHARARRRWTALAVVGLGVVLALGPTWRIGSWSVPLPWEWLARLVPGFTIQRQTYVTSNLVGTGMICLAGLGAAWLVERARARRAWAVGLALVGALALGTYEWRLPPANVVGVAGGARVPAVYAWLAAHGAGEPLLELPTPLPLNAVYAYFSTYHWLPIFNGSYSYPPPGYEAASTAASSVLSSEREARDFVRDWPVRLVLVHGDLLSPRERERLDPAPAHLEEVARFGADVVYRLRSASDEQASPAVGKRSRPR